jgi:hypothetical protein
MSDRNAYVDVCLQVSQRHLNNKAEDGYASDVHCGRSAANDFDSRRRCRAVHMMYYLASEPNDKPYAAIIAKCDEPIISVIRAIAREYDRGFMGCLPSQQSLGLSRYIKPIGNPADYTNSLKPTQELLLKPRKR